MSQFSHAQQMLALSLLSYRGFWNPDRENQRDLVSTMGDGLNKLAPLQGQWKLLWGPGTYRYLGAILDSSLMYVVQHRSEPWRIAVVVRGTNPVEIFDWLFGDFLTHRQVPWHHPDLTHAPDAQVSLSTALGLNILLNLRCQLDEERVDDARLFDLIARLTNKGVAAAQSIGVTAGLGLGALTSGDEIGSAGAQLQKLMSKLPNYRELWTLGAQSVENSLYGLGSLLSDELILQMLSMRRRMVELLDRSLDARNVAPVAVLMPEREEPEVQAEKGVNLVELVRALQGEFGEQLHISVTGHSKGGSLAPPLALYLLEKTHGYGVPPRRLFQRRPRYPLIDCYAFAGPTPGNGAFSRYFNARLGRQFYRYVNRRDIACLAWNSERLREVPGLFGDLVTAVPGLQSLVDQVADEVLTLDYQQPGEDYRVWRGWRRQTEQHLFFFDGPLDARYRSYISQWVYQHVDAYIQALGLQDVLDVGQTMGVDFLSDRSRAD